MKEFISNEVATTRTFLQHELYQLKLRTPKRLQGTLL